MQTIIIDQQVCRNLEALSYTLMVRREIAAQTIMMGLDASGPEYQRAEDRAIAAMKEYDAAKKKLEACYRPVGTWNLDFATRALTAERFEK